MRVLCVSDGSTGELEVVELLQMGFDSDLTGVRDEDMLNGECLEGLLLIDSNGYFGYIEGIPLSTCNNICRDILRSGYYDLSQYGECVWQSLDE